MARRASGYTILEVMIFLGVSAFIFITAAVAVGGRQQQVQYTQAVRDFESQMQDVLNDVATGYYPTPNGVRCQIIGSGAGARPQIYPLGMSPPVEQGGSDECMSVGKAILFNITGGTNNSEYAVANMVGIKPTIYEQPQVSAEATHPILAREETPGLDYDLTEYKGLRFNSEVSGIFDAGNTSVAYGAFVIASGFGSASSIRNGLVETNLYASTVGLGQTMNAYKSALDGLNGPTIVRPANGIVVCLVYPGDNKRSRVFIGEGGNTNNIRTELDVTSGVCS